MKYENPKMEIVILREYSVITASTLVDEGYGGSGGDDDDDQIGFQ